MPIGDRPVCNSLLIAEEGVQLKEQILFMAKLQEIDELIGYHEGNLARLPLEVQDIAKNLVVLRREISEANDKIATLEQSMRQKERDLAVEQDKIKRSEKRLLQIKNQKEHAALNREIKLGKKVVGEIEEEILRCMDEVENLKKSLERKERDYATFEENLTMKKAEAAEATDNAQESLTRLKAEREELSGSVERDLLKKYDTIKNVRGNALAEMKDGSCTACYMSLPPQLAIRVLKQEELLTCPNCNRILYARPENIPEYNKLRY